MKGPAGSGSGLPSARAIDWRTTSAHGASSAHKSDWAALAGRDVVIFPDHDPEGERYAEAVRRELAGQSPRPTVRVVRLRDLWGTDEPIPEGGDAAEWHCRGPLDAPPSGSYTLRACHGHARSALPGLHASHIAMHARSIDSIAPMSMPIGRIIIRMVASQTSAQVMHIDAQRPMPSMPAI